MRAGSRLLDFFNMKCVWNGQEPVQQGRLESIGNCYPSPIDSSLEATRSLFPIDPVPAMLSGAWSGALAVDRLGGRGARSAFGADEFEGRAQRFAMRAGASIMPPYPGCCSRMNADRQWALEGLAGGLQELEKVLGSAAVPVLRSVRAHLLAALAARDRGDRDGLKQAIARAMDELSGLGQSLDPAEGAMMKALSEQFRSGMAAEDRDAMERNLDRIQARTGQPKQRKEM